MKRSAQRSCGAAGRADDDHVRRRGRSSRSRLRPPLWHSRVLHELLEPSGRARAPSSTHPTDIELDQTALSGSPICFCRPSRARRVEVQPLPRRSSPATLTSHDICAAALDELKSLHGSSASRSSARWAAVWDSLGARTGPARGAAPRTVSEPLASAGVSPSSSAQSDRLTLKRSASANWTVRKSSSAVAAKRLAPHLSAGTLCPRKRSARRKWDCRLAVGTWTRDASSPRERRELEDELPSRRAPSA